MFTDIAVEHNDWITVPFDVTTAVHEYGSLGPLSLKVGNKLEKYGLIEIAKM